MGDFRGFPAVIKMFVLGLLRGLLSDAEMLENIVERFLATYLSASDFA